MHSSRIFISIIFLAHLIFLISCNQARHDDKRSTKEIQNEKLTGDERTAEVTDSEKSQPANITGEKITRNIEMDTILGPWIRPDGNYILEFTKINQDKTLEANYYNPKPIHISLAQIKKEDRIKIFVEFDDVNYRGSYYDLQYDPANDALTGNYYQATYGQTYAIAFIRYQPPQ